ncbi:MAG: hypothetical protein L3J95_02015 [Thermoplasmata archaeon]|nr:hypothetical protein [Thermoplasmata archaeon]MCI4359187.1 hypothetical protein [Thermoplasmata archaeon]
MTPRRVIAFWAAVVGFLFLIEIAELTRLFTLPLLSALGNLISFIFALVFTTILALVGAVFIGIYISQRMQSAGGFTVFEEEMLRMRSDVQKLREDVAELRQSLEATSGPTEDDPTRREAR